MCMFMKKNLNPGLCRSIDRNDQDLNFAYEALKPDLHEAHVLKYILHTEYVAYIEHIEDHYNALISDYHN